MFLRPAFVFASACLLLCGYVTRMFLPAATKLWPRLRFNTCVWFCSQGGVSGQGEPPSPRAGRTPPEQTPPQDQTPQSRHPLPPGTRPYPPSPWSRHPPPPGSRLQHTAYERPVRILLECILVCFGFFFKLKCLLFKIKFYVFMTIVFNLNFYQTTKKV